MWGAHVALCAIQHWGLPVHPRCIKLSIQPEIVSSSKRGTKCDLAQNFWDRSTVFLSASQSAALKLLLLAELVEFNVVTLCCCSTRASLRKPSSTWDIQRLQGHSRCTQQCSDKDTPQDCWGLKIGAEFSNSMLWPQTPEQGKLVCPLVYKKTVRSKAVYCLMYW